MADEAKNAPAGVAKQTEGTAEVPVIVPEAGKEGTEQIKEVTAGEALGKPTTEVKPKEEPRMVPEAVFLDLKKDLKLLQKQIAEGNTTKGEVSQSLKDIGEKHDVDPDFLQELAGAIKSETEADFNKRLEKELEPYKEQNKKTTEKERETVFNEHYNKTLEALPEFKDIAQRDVIKALAMDPANANKTFKQIFEIAFGHLVTGKRTLDGAQPGSGKDITEIDFEKARKDSDYFAQIMGNPALKAKYNEGLAQRLKL